jgi:hypothetical protein
MASSLPQTTRRASTLSRRRGACARHRAHLVLCAEGNQFEQPIAQYWMALASRLPDDSTLRLSDWNVPLFTLSGVEDGLQVRFSWHEVPGAPSRHHLHIWEQAVLAPDQWMQVRFNARRLDFGGDWNYEKHVLNTGVVDAFVPSLFVNDSPDHRFSDMADPY